LIGPAPAFVQRTRGRWRWHLLLRTPDPLPVLAALGPLYGWTVDVDPVHVL
jgi:primosomal protein N' (replication factor Y)